MAFIGSSANQSGLIALAGGGQLGATKLNYDINVVGTVATAGDSVLLPSAQAGGEVILINAGAKAMQVYGTSNVVNSGGAITTTTDSINGVVGTTGISQPPNTIATYICGKANTWYSVPGQGFNGGNIALAVENAITAHSGGTQAAAYQLTAQLSRVTTVAVAADSVALPVALAGMKLTVINAAAANAMNLYANNNSVDVINALSQGTAISVVANKTIECYCAVNGTWNTVLTA